MDIPLRSRKLFAIFEEIGSEERLLQILEDFYVRMSKDILLMHFFLNKDPKHVAQKQTEFLLKAMGVRETYGGKPPQTAHTELPKILSGHFDRRLVVLEQTLKDHGLSQKSRENWLNFEASFREVLVVEE